MADAVDLKSTGINPVPVRPRVAAPLKEYIMFRVDDDKKYGIGTMVVFGQRQWLLISLSDTSVGALDVHELEVVSVVSVQDPLWISRREFDELFNFSGCTYTDFTLHTGVTVKSFNY